MRKDPYADRPLSERELSEVRQRYLESLDEEWPECWHIGLDDMSRLLATVDQLCQDLEQAAHDLAEH